MDSFTSKHQEELKEKEQTIAQLVFEAHESKATLLRHQQHNQSLTEEMTKKQAALQDLRDQLESLTSKHYTEISAKEQCIAQLVTDAHDYKTALHR